MNKIITEDIIKRALDESIEEFMLEEANWKGWAGAAGSMLGNIGKNIWNGVKMYMDYRTNGQWNNKYGQYANGNGKMTEMYYLNKWFNFHLGEIQDIMRNAQNPNSAQKLRWERDPNTGKEFAVQTLNNYGSIKNYVVQNVTCQNFNNWIKNYIQNREAVTLIDSYIEYCTKSIKDINSAIKLLNISSFMASDYGKQYLTYSKEQQQQQDLNNYFNSRQNSGAYN